VPRDSNHFLDLLDALSGVLVALTLSSQAAEVYTFDFETTSYDGGSGAFVLGGDSSDVEAGDWFGATQGVSFGSGDLTFDWDTATRYRGAGVWLDTSTWGDVAATVIVSVDVSDYTAGVDGSSIFFQTFAANGVDDSNSVSLDLHAGDSAVSATTGSATIAMFGDEQTISGAGTQEFTFTYNGTDQ
jgi:hypothetical protein